MQEKKFEQIDALRFFAVLPVLISHWSVSGLAEETQFMLASNGVNLFFAISGFLITLGLIRTREKEQSVQTSLWKFYVRRTLRIFPIYYLMLLLLWFFNHSKVADGIAWYLTYSTNFYCIKIQDWGGLSHLWSLAIEEQFYLVWPFLILFSTNQTLPITIGFAIVTSISFKIFWLLTGASFWVYYMSPLAVIDVLGLGALLSYFYYFQKEKLRLLLHNYIFIAIVILQLILMLYFRFDHRYQTIYQVFNRSSFGLFFVWIIGRSVFGFGGAIGYILTIRPILFIGKISYGIYLFHILIPGMLIGLKYPTSHIPRFSLYFAVTIAICSVSWYLFESKILKIKDKFD